MVTEADRLLAEGRTITFKDGSTATIRFGMRALKQLEDEYGSIPAACNKLGELVQQTDALVGPLLKVIVPGLMDEKNSDGSPKYTEDNLLDLLRTEDMAKNITDGMAALAESLPNATTVTNKPEGTQGNAPAPGQPAPITRSATNGGSPKTTEPAPQEATTVSTGAASTTSPPSPSGAPTNSSGE